MSHGEKRDDHAFSLANLVERKGQTRLEMEEIDLEKFNVDPDDVLRHFNKRIVARTPEFNFRK